jgi:hypothetical protein
MILRQWNSDGRARQLLDVVEFLGEVTADIQTLAEIPKVLTTVLPLEWASFSLTRQGDSGEAQTIVTAQYRRDTEGEVETALTEIEGTNIEDGRVEIVREVGARYQMKLALQRGRDREGMEEQWNEMVETVCETLMRALRTLVAWREQPELLGGSFSAMTGAQWRGARVLGTGFSGKQLAKDLKISPHTLHCYVKAVYRKLGVRNRMAAVQLLDQAARHYRLRTREWPVGTFETAIVQSDWRDCVHEVEMARP